MTSFFVDLLAAPKLPLALAMGALALAVSAPVGAQERPCSGPNQPPVEVVSRLATPQWNLNTPAEQLTLAAQASRPGETDGLTDFHVVADLNLLDSATPEGCPVRAVQVVIRQSRLEVYIAKEVLRSSCRWRAVYDHELKHVLLAQRAIDLGVSTLRKQLTAAVTGLSPMDAQNVEAFRSALLPVVHAHMEKVGANYAKGNEELDTPEEARRMARLCQAPEASIGGKVLQAESGFSPQPK